MCIYSPMPHTLSYCALIGKCALIRSNTVFKECEKKMYSFSYFVEKIHIVNWENVIEIFENMGHL